MDVRLGLMLGRCLLFLSKFQAGGVIAVLLIKNEYLICVYRVSQKYYPVCNISLGKRKIDYLTRSFGFGISHWSLIDSVSFFTQFLTALDPRASLNFLSWFWNHCSVLELVSSFSRFLIWLQLLRLSLFLSLRHKCSRWDTVILLGSLSSATQRILRRDVFRGTLSTFIWLVSWMCTLMWTFHRYHSHGEQKQIRYVVDHVASQVASRCAA